LYIKNNKEIKYKIIKMFISEWLSGENTKIKKANFEDIQYAIHHPQGYLLLNTLSNLEQDCLILGTIPAVQEENIINEIITRVDIPDKRIIIYGKNTSDSSAEKKYNQLQKLGIPEIAIYSGGLFEWLLLQDIYGNKEFPTTKKTIDIIKYKPEKCFI
jgi:hypothetical protein